MSNASVSTLSTALEPVGMAIPTSTDIRPEPRSAVGSEQSREVRNIEAVVVAQIRNLEATVDQLLQQATGSMRKDIANREERLTRRMDGDRKEQQGSLQELRREVFSQQSSDLGALEDRLMRRLDTEKREQKATVAELRRDIGIQQEHRAQIANLRRDVAATQDHLAVLAQSRVVGSESDSRTEAQLTQATAVAEAAIADLRREVSAMSEQIQLQASSTESLQAGLGGIRAELSSQQASEMRELCGRFTVVEASAGKLRSEMTSEVAKVRSEMESERSRFETRVGQLSAIELQTSAVARRVEEAERRLDEVRRDHLSETTVLQGRLDAATALTRPDSALQGRVELLENSVRNVNAALPHAAVREEDVTSIREALDGTRGDVAKLAQVCKDVATSKEVGDIRTQLAEARSRVAALASQSGAGASNKDVADLREALDETRGDLAQVAKACQEAVSATTQDKVANSFPEPVRKAIEDTRDNLAHALDETRADLARLARGVEAAEASAKASVALAGNREELSSVRLTADETRDKLSQLAQDLAEYRTAAAGGVANSAVQSEDFKMRIEAVEAKCNRSVAMLNSQVDKTGVTLADDLSRERNERSNAFADMSNRMKEEINALATMVDGALADARSVRSRDTAEIHQLLAEARKDFASHKESLVRERSLDAGGEVLELQKRAVEDVRGDMQRLAMDSSERFRAIESRLPDRSAAPSDTALASCVGELDAELRLEMAARMERLHEMISTEVRAEISSAVGALDTGLRSVAGDMPALERRFAELSTRFDELGTARLEHRILALEASGASSPKPVDRPDISVRRPAAVESSRLADNAGRQASAQQPGYHPGQVAENAPFEDSLLHSRTRPYGTGDTVYPGDSASNVHSSHLAGSKPAGALAALGQTLALLQGPLGDPSTEAHEPPISEELKARLESLVQQVNLSLQACDDSPYAAEVEPAVPPPAPAPAPVSPPAAVPRSTNAMLRGLRPGGTSPLEALHSLATQPSASLAPPPFAGTTQPSASPAPPPFAGTLARGHEAGGPLPLDRGSSALERGSSPTMRGSSPLRGSQSPVRAPGLPGPVGRAGERAGNPLFAGGGSLQVQQPQTFAGAGPCGGSLQMPERNSVYGAGPSNSLSAAPGNSLSGNAFSSPSGGFSGRQGLVPDAPAGARWLSGARGIR